VHYDSTWKKMAVKLASMMAVSSVYPKAEPAARSVAQLPGSTTHTEWLYLGFRVGLVFGVGTAEALRRERWLAHCRDTTDRNRVDQLTLPAARRRWYKGPGASDTGTTPALREAVGSRSAL